jgi:hypothetical protein
MVDTVDTKVIRNAGGHYTVVLQNRSDGTGESGVVKVDVSTLLNAAGAAATYTSIERIDFSVWGFNYVLLAWDANTDDEIATLGPGAGHFDWTYEGGATDPKSTGTVGDIKLTTSGGAAGSGYDITMRLKLK